MKYRNVLLTGVMVLLAAYLPAAAQADHNIDLAMQAIKEIQHGYNTRPMSFDIVYTYSNEHTPGKVLDSMKGRIELSGADSRCLLRNTESIHNSRYNVILFAEDKIMYLAKSDTAVNSADLLQPIRTALQTAGVTDCGISYQGSKKTVQISFRAGAPYKSLQITVDTLSGHLQAMRYVVKTALLMDAAAGGDATPGEGYEEYATVQAVFENYDDTPPGQDRFDEQAFFQREGTDLKVTAAYQDYKIFIGSPNL
ncbi:hypothetical protein F0L74_11785 [Chitinophaga agrisoli]|uniref:Outer membrane lipoprotein-sorting protein n=1 Tax=Chitinophaga agrisoli TaxID=2607653 RepID=A0A5B2VYW6_9BACT|nr:hypothetical protein [Chitinophaga agrisoli]KAA2243189.1 hypothetical protein F0L74_11785 [Chitinophaga agrisoli]